MARAPSPRAATKKTSVKKSTAKKTGAKKTGAEKSGAEKTVRKYSPKASDDVRDEMRELKRGTLRSGSGAKVTDPKQAIAIGLSKARRAGAKVPEPPEST